VIDAPASAGPPRRSAPPKERPARPTPQITAVLAVLSILANYARHLVKTLEQRAAGRGFATIARFFGTVTLDTILAHLHRGLMRAMALERMLKLRAERGRDLKILAPRESREPRAKAPETGAEAAAVSPEEVAAKREAAAQAAALRAGERLARRIAADEPLTLATLPRMAVIQAEVLRSQIGCSVAAICRDFGLSAMLCDGMFWNAVCDSIEWYRGNLGTFIIELKQREYRFSKEEWKHPGLELPEENRAGVRRVLGFFVGEEPADPEDPADPVDPVDPFKVVAGPGVGVAAIATGPP